MPIKQGSTNFGSLYLGSTKIGSAYYGSTLVFGSERATIGDKSYKVTRIGNQIWMAENLCWEMPASQYSVALSIGGEYLYKPTYVHAHYWESITSTPVNVERGLYYNWAFANLLYTNQNMGFFRNALNGFHMPSRADWETLSSYLGSSTAGTKVKSTTGWYNDINGDGSTKFDAKPYGYVYANISGGSDVAQITSGSWAGSNQQTYFWAGNNEGNSDIGYAVQLQALGNMYDPYLRVTTCPSWHEFPIRLVKSV